MDRLGLIEVLDRDGHVVQAVPVAAWPIHVGRALDCAVLLHDPFTAARHVSFSQAVDSAQIVLTVGDSANGVLMAVDGTQRRLRAGASVAVGGGAVIQAGRTFLRLRLPGEALAAEERLDHPAQRRRFLLTVAAYVSLLAWVLASQWLNNDPDSGWDKYLPGLIGAGFGVVGWAALWGLGSKLFLRHFHIVPHLRVVLAFLLGSLAANAVLALASFALSMPLLSHVREWVEIVIVGGLLATHVAILLPARGRRIAVTFGALCVLSIAVSGALNWRHHQRVFEELYVATLPPPAFRLVRAGPPAGLIDALRPLRARLDRQAKEDEDRDEFGGPSD